MGGGAILSGWLNTYLTLVFVVMVLSAGHYASGQGFSKMVYWLQMLQIIVATIGMGAFAVLGDSRFKSRWWMPVGRAVLGVLAVLMAAGVGFMLIYAPMVPIGNGGGVVFGKWLARWA